MRKKIFLAASFLPLTATVFPANAETTGPLELPTYSIDFRRAVQIAQLELAKTARSGLANESEVATSKTSGGLKDAQGDGGYKDSKGGGSKTGSGAATDRYKTDGGYKESKGAGGSKTGSGAATDAYKTDGGYKDSKGAGGSKTGSGAATDGYKTDGGYKDSKGAGGSKTGSGAATDGYKTDGGYKEGGAADGYKTAGGYKEGKEAGAADANAGKATDGYKGSAGIAEYMKSGRGGQGNLELKLERGASAPAEGNSRSAPRGLGGVKMDSEGSTAGAIKIDFESAGKTGPERGASVSDSLRPIGGEAAGPAKELQLATPPRTAPVLAPAAPALAPATPVAKPAIVNTPLLVPSVLPGK
jgi:hypothetical protein